jgi:2,4-dienoyl-CoA reductase-like NADH-dependent reductase (Old Yellow Enzyme family)
MAYTAIFSPLKLRSFTIKNRILRSNIAGLLISRRHRRAAADQLGSEIRARRRRRHHLVVRAGSSARAHPANYATIVSDDRIPFWRELGKQVHAHDCSILQLSHGGRQRDIPTIDYPLGLSSTDKDDPLHGFQCERMTLAQIKETVQAFAEGARRAREAGLTASSSTGERLSDHPVPELGDQRSRRRVWRRAGKPGQVRPRDRPGDPGARGTRLPPADEDQRH